RVVADADPALAGRTLRLLADGAMPTEVRLDGRAIDVVVPWLMIRASIQRPRGELDDVEHPIEPPLRALRQGERLVGHTSIDMDAALPGFADGTVLPVHRPAPLLAASSPMAWDALDGLVLDARLLGGTWQHSGFADA